MTIATPEQIWWTAAEIAAAGLPGLPATKRGVNDLAARLGWCGDTAHARRRAGRGGGWEYHWKLFPIQAQRKLLSQSNPKPMATKAPRDEVWAWFEAQPDTVQSAARERLRIICAMEAIEPALGKFGAVADVARLEGIAPRTVWNWLSMIDGVSRDDRLAYLAPRHRAAVRKSAKVDCAPEFMDALKSDFLRASEPSFTSCWRRATRLAEKNGWAGLEERSARRRLNAEVSRPTQILARKGVDALKRLYPSQTRDKTALHALEVVNADFHRFDVFVRWPVEHGQNEPAYVGRPQMVAFQDVHSGRILAWRVDQTPNALAVRLAAGDMIETWGIPEHVLLDNGREFAAKAITGGAPTRYRFQVREDDIPGLFVSLGCEIHWATPYSGQSKPIERAFRDMCDAISRDPRFAGAYTGNSPEAKPEDYGSRAVELEEFLAVVAEGIEEHNSRTGRRSEVAFDRSFGEAFDASYATAPIRKATEAQRRLWLLGAEGLRGDSKSGLLRFQGNEYWAAWMSEIAGERVIVRFDPAALWDGLHVYSADNAYLGHAPCKAKVGFLDLEEARAHAKARRAWLAAEKAALAAHRKLRAAELGAALDAAPIAPASSVEAKVVRPVFRKIQPTKPEPRAPEIDRAQAELVADIASRRASVPVEEPSRERFRRALELERARERGDAVTADQQRWLAAYQTTAEYAAERLLWEDFGDAFFG